MGYSTASVCLSPVFTAQAFAYLAGRLPLCTVIGFPSGAHSTKVKVLELTDAVQNGAQELDMVIHVGMVKEARWAAVLEELRAMKEACEGRILKVIVETCLLTQDEKIRLCALVAESGADFIKTSTGFGTGGATVEDVALFRRELPPHVKVKASGGIRSRQAAENLLRAGADRLGSSVLVALAREAESLTV
jgi:deoxyribose-phosphate aldolase